MLWFIAHRVRMDNHSNPWTVVVKGYENHNSKEFKEIFAWHRRNRDREVVKVLAETRQDAMDKLKER